MTAIQSKFRELLPQLVAAYRKGELVPFIGAGISRPACASWEGLIKGLEQLAGGTLANAPKCADVAAENCRRPPMPSDLIRRADRAVNRLLLRGDSYLHQACRDAVRSPGCDHRAPTQAVSLGRTSWSLVLTTNYDDWFPSVACNKPRILGRSVRDCQQVISSLTTSTAPILWAVQGYLGGQATPPYSVPDEQASALASQIVVGHHDYQRVINTEPHFRRAFADVFRRRSFLFLGSGLTEDYLINLFSEILLTYGPGHLPHYAMLTEDEAGSHGDFFRSRLNITPVVYKGHDELPALLDTLAAACSASKLTQQPAGRLEEHYLLSGSPSPPARVVLRWGQLPACGSAECVALSVGRDGDGRLLLGSQARDYLNSHYPDVSAPEQKFRKMSQIVYRFDATPVFAVAARTEPADAKDLRNVAPAICELLEATASLRKETVTTGLIAAGPSRKWHPIFSLIEMLRGARQAAEKLGESCPSLVVTVVDPSVWFPLLAGKINVEEVLSGANIRFWAETRPLHGEGGRILCVRPEGETVAAVASLFGFVDGDEVWGVEVHPQPCPDQGAESLCTAWQKDLNAVGVVHGSTLLFRQRPHATAECPSGKVPVAATG